MNADEPVAPSGAGGLVRVRLDVAYDGTPYAGWARQPGRPTVQGALEDALATVLRRAVTLTVAGRTDAGVHATGQVCHYDGPLVEPRRVNGVLDPSVRVLSAVLAPDGFDARFSALARRYVYRVADADYGALPTRRHDTATHPRPVSLRRVQAASKPLLGLRDFAAFCRRREGATTVRTLRRLTWVRDPDGVLVANVEADAFCHQMVRSLVGALLLAGDGRRPVDWPATLLADGVRDGRAPVAPANGLTLAEVRYPASSRLAARAAATRRVRDAADPPPSGV
ncbi:MAG TPA: tRNA pseudouridine(38-40) synthase TruA [Mycobacteriales bacterium]|jgi:tRNA pseudouridine38-40 synthase|nr:tRNA pseudouridine(38-40) synthase TruA [Mycobacteriales bacterium]